jgi:hypothetical protein
VFSDHFDALISKMIFKNKKKYHFDAFPNEKHFENTIATTLPNGT